MAFDEGLAARLRKVFAGRTEVTERRMFGGLAFLVRGNMCVGIVDHDLMVRVGPENHDHALGQPHARAMDFTGKPMNGMVYVAPAGFARAPGLRKWVNLALAFVDRLPARATKSSGTSTSRTKSAKAKPTSRTKSMPKTSKAKKSKSKSKAKPKSEAKSVGKKKTAKAAAAPKAKKRAAGKAKASASQAAPPQEPAGKAASPKTKQPSSRPAAARATQRPSAPPKSQRPSARPKSQRPSTPPKSQQPGARPKSQRPSARPKSLRPSAPSTSQRPSAGWRSLAPATAASLRPTSLRPPSQRPTPSRRPPPEPGSFKGFSGSTKRFLKGITEHNDKAWFEAHRNDYEHHYLTPALAFINDLGPRLVKLSPRLNFEPRVNGSLFRIQRDIRFSKDKTPYKNHIDLWFWHGDRKSWSTPGFFFRLEPQRLTLGAGVHRFDAAQLERYRAAVVHPKRGPALTPILQAIEAQGPYRIGGLARKTVPKAYPSDHPRAPLLLHEGLYASFERSPPAVVASKDFVDWCVEHYRALAPLCRWLLAL